MIKVPGPDEDFGEEAYDYFRSLTEGKEFAAVVFTKPNAKVHEVCLYDPARIKTGAATASLESIVKKSVNADMLREGLGTITKEGNRRLQDELRRKVAAAKAGQLALDKAPKSELEVLSDAQEEAHKGRKNLWRFGDPFGDDM